jgi:hypothetical protein
MSSVKNGDCFRESVKLSKAEPPKEVVLAEVTSTLDTVTAVTVTPKVLATLSGN